jgi:hypothetical protein
MLLSAVALVSRLIHSHNQMLSEDKQNVNQILAYSFEGEDHVGNEIRKVIGNFALCLNKSIIICLN